MNDSTQQALHCFVGMPGVQGELRGPMAKSAAAIISAVKVHRVASWASDNGSVMLYRDDTGILQGVICRFGAVIDQATFRTQTAAKLWISAALGKIQ